MSSRYVPIPSTRTTESPQADQLEQNEPILRLDLNQDVRNEAETLGPVTNVILYDKEPEGVMTVRFTDSKDADACVKVRLLPAPLSTLHITSAMLTSPHTADGRPSVWGPTSRGIHRRRARALQEN